MKHAADTQFEESTIKAVHAYKDGGWQIEKEDGWAFYIPPESPVEPKPGMTVRMYGKGIGYTVRGVTLDGQVVYYRTEEEDIRHSEERRYGKDVDDLLRKWDADEIVWSCEMGGISPGYEQAIQITAFEVLRYLAKEKPDPLSLEDSEKWKAFKAGLESAIFPKLKYLGLSGAQWGGACNLAFMFYHKGPIEAVKSIPEDRKMQVSKHFPSAPKESEAA